MALRKDSGEDNRANGSRGVGGEGGQLLRLKLFTSKMTGKCIWGGNMALIHGGCKTARGLFSNKGDRKSAGHKVDPYYNPLPLGETLKLLIHRSLGTPRGEGLPVGGGGRRGRHCFPPQYDCRG